MLTIKFNGIANKAMHNLTNVNDRQMTAISRLSSGLRVNSAADNSADLAISSRMSTNLRSLSRSILNINDGISLVQVSESSVDSLKNLTSRLRELAVQSANGVNSDRNRQALDAESRQLLAEFQRVTETTSFNGINLYESGGKEFKFQVGTERNQTIAFAVEDFSANAIGNISQTRVVSRATSSTFDYQDLSLNGVAVSSVRAIDDTVSTQDNDASAIAKAAAVNRVSDESGVEAIVRSTVAEGTAMTGFSASGTAWINGVAISVYSFGVDFEADREVTTSAVNSVSSQTGVYAINTHEDATGVRLIAEDGRNIHVDSTIPDRGTGLPTTNSMHYGSIELRSDDEIILDQSRYEGDIRLTGFSAGSYVKNDFNISVEQTSQDALAAGDLVINGISVGESIASYDPVSTVSADASALAKVTAINKVSDFTGVQASAFQTFNKGFNMGGSAWTGAFSINGVDTATMTLTGQDVESARVFVAATINNISNQTGVYAVDTGDRTTGLDLYSIDGRNINVGSSGGATTTQIQSATGVTLGTHTAGFKLSSRENINLDTLTGDIENSGFTIVTGGDKHFYETLADISLETQEGAMDAIETIDFAINAMLEYQVNLGATLSRFESSASVNASTVENLTIAKSRILDADYAKEAASIAKNMVVQSAAQKVLGGTLLSQELILSLLA